MGNKSKYVPQYNSENSALKQQANEYDGSYPLYDSRQNLEFAIEREKYASGQKYLWRIIKSDWLFNRERIRVCSVNELQESFWDLSARFKYRGLSVGRVQLAFSTAKGYGEFIIRHNLTAQEIRENKFVPDSFDFFFPKWEEIPVRIERVKGEL